MEEKVLEKIKDKVMGVVKALPFAGVMLKVLSLMDPEDDDQ